MNVRLSLSEGFREFIKVISWRRIASSRTDDFSVVIPIFNGAPFLSNLKKSIGSPKYRIVLVDDCSNDLATINMINEWSTESNVTLIRNPKNLGYCESVNRAAREISGDFILLNSDTEVYGDWAEKLISRLRKTPKLAAVTPFSNSATIYSFPDPTLRNDLPISISAIHLAAAVNKFTQTPSAPTTHGFCVAIKRKAWVEVGEYNVDKYSIGYGEENDWSMRAMKLGYFVGLAPDVFVSHIHGGSFTPEIKAERMKKSQEQLIEDYPEYPSLVSLHVSNDPWKFLRDRISSALDNC
jgi:GT2 family glycosyltransferase